LSVAVWLERHGCEGFLKKLLEFMKWTIVEKRAEEVAESRDLALLTALLRNVDRDDFYPTSTIKSWLAAEIEEEEPRWLNTQWVGRALKRLGFTEKRKVHGRIEWHLTPEGVLVRSRRYISSLCLDDELKHKYESLSRKISPISPNSPTLGDCERAVLDLMHRKRLEGVEWLFEHEIMALLGKSFGELLIKGALDALVRAGKLIREETPEGVRYRLAG